MSKKSLPQVRIIGGQWRSRKIVFPALADIRPTPDRVRETLFNWLTPYIENAYCLDLFAGSGALGFEALSRGARHVVMVDKSPIVIEELRENAQLLKTTHVTLFQGKAPDNVILPNEPFDIVFLDPPFHHDLIKPSWEWLVSHRFITTQSLIYIETAKTKEKLLFPENCFVLKQGQTKQIDYYLTQLGDGGSKPTSNCKSA
jgi:16S rRNA (guanine966-N2)-methyltransferase